MSRRCCAKSKRVRAAGIALARSGQLPAAAFANSGNAPVFTPIFLSISGVRQARNPLSSVGALFPVVFTAWKAMSLVARNVLFR
ncbi:Uncharacterised protein [Salmonella enterica subsp. enterica serovar Bovismorbificans]|nr:Uncharacterised protein [Salmonella enterica subsp. enterica serovar Bovismorbificans]